jgi:O-antigen/teichoic acid export membrane protein
MIPLVNLIPEYQKWQPALLGVSLFAINYAWAAISTPLTNTLNAVGKVNKTLMLMIMWTGLTWTVTPLAIIWYGFNGVAIASAVISFSSIVTIMMTKSAIPFDFWKNIWRQLLATGAMLIIGVLGLPLWQQSFFNMGLGIVLTGSVFAIVFLSVGWKSLIAELTSLGIWPKLARRFQSS